MATFTKEDQRFLDFTNVSYWHDRGYTGKLGLTATGEGWNPKAYNADGMVDRAQPFPEYSQDMDSDGHPINTAQVFHFVAPERKLVQLPTYGSCIGGVEKSDYIDKALPYCKEHDVDVMFVSKTCDVAIEAINNMLKTMPNLSLLMSAGNEHSSAVIRADNIIAVGAYYIRYGDPADPNFADSEFMDFSAPTMVGGFHGTSCSAPFLAGMSSIINHFFKVKTGRPLSRYNMYQFYKDCAMDLGKVGFDSNYGWGAPILPKPETIDIAKYQKELVMPDWFNRVDEWAKPWIKEAYMRNLITGGGARFDPKAALDWQTSVVLNMKMSGHKLTK